MKIKLVTGKSDNYLKQVINYLLLFTPWEFFISVLADGISLEFEWQQVSLSLQDISL